MGNTKFHLTLVALGVVCFLGKAHAVQGIVSSGLDTTGGIVANADSDGDGTGIFAIVVGSNYDGYGDPGSAPGNQAQFQVNTNSVQMNRNTVITNGGTLNVAGATTLSSTLGVTGVTTIGGATTINNSLVTNNGTNAANLTVNSSLNQASLTVRSTAVGSTDSGIFINGVDTGVAKPSTQIKGGTRSGILTLQDGDAPSNIATPAGSSLTISGSGGGTAATVFQTTTNTNTTSVNTSIGTSAVYSGGSTATLQAGPTNAVSVNSGNVGSSPGVSINGTVGAGSTSTTGVLITGSGQNAQPYTASDRANGAIPTWADVAIQSKSYGLGDPTLGSAILVTDYGIQFISPQPIAGQQITNSTSINNSTGNITNNNGLNTSSGSVINNNGLNSGSGSVVNNNGGISGSGSATNNIGMNTSTTGGTAINNIGGISGNGSVTNGFGNNNSSTGGLANNNIGMNTGNGTVNNSFGGGSGSGSTSNTIGQNTGTGTLTNSIGNANTIAGVVTNNSLGVNNGAGLMTNNLGGGTGSSTNNIGVGSGLATNNIGTGPGQSINTIGSSTLGSSLATQAGNTTSYMTNGVSTTNVSAGGGVGGSVLAFVGTTSGNSAIVLKDSSASHVVVDANGKMQTATGTVAQTSASMTVTNGLGNTHGFYVNERQATISGGSRSSSLTLNDNGAKFSDSNTGAPIRVHGVNDGASAYDAVNVRQLYGGIAASMATAPAINDLKPGESGVGVGTGFYGGYSAVGVGFSHYVNSGPLFNLGIARSMQDGSRTAVRMSLGFKF